jgi:hypothetical protein
MNKNIHILPTDKPSRIVKHNAENNYKILPGFISSNPAYTTQHIYITSDEEIKEGDWCFDIFLDAVFQANCFMGIKTKNTAKKIILTTDPDLIKDGVRAIDDEFLQWFVNNPNCDSVETVIEKMFPMYESFPESINKPPFYGNLKYKIITPQEKPEEDYFKYLKEAITQSTKQSGYSVYIPEDVVKKEELEEAIDRIAKEDGYDIDGGKVADFVDGMVKGAKWQAERMYSEEEVRKMLWELGDCLFNNCQNGIKEGEPETYFDDIISQFKKK